MSGLELICSDSKDKMEAIPDEARKVVTLWDRIFVLEEISLQIG